MRNFGITLALAATLPFSALADDAKDESDWGGNVELGAHFATGNTESKSYNAAAELNYTPGDWEHAAAIEMINKEENDVHTDEEYRVDLSTQYNFTDADFFFGEANFVKDRFSGYDYRISEVVGYGHEWFDLKFFKWKSQLGVGMQHSETTAGVAEDSPLARFENNINLQITKTTSLTNMIRVDASDINVLRTETALKNAISESLFLKIGVDTESLSEVPAGTKKTDTDTKVNIAYEF